MKYFTVRSIRMLTVAIVLATGSIVGAQSLNFSRHETERACSNRTLLGDYGVKIKGTLLGPNWPLRTLALFHFDGSGGITTRSHVVLNGIPPAEEWATAAGSYSMNPDCTGSGSIEAAPPIPFHLVVVNGGREFYLVVDGNAITGEGRTMD